MLHGALGQHAIPSLPSDSPQLRANRLTFEQTAPNSEEVETSLEMEFRAGNFSSEPFPIPRKAPVDSQHSERSEEGPKEGPEKPKSGL